MVSKDDAHLFIAKEISLRGDMSQEAQDAVYAFTEKLMCFKRLKSTPYSRQKDKEGPGKIYAEFTEHAGSDKYGYIVIHVGYHGNEIKARGYDSVKDDYVVGKGDLCLKWHPRLDQGRGLWVKMGEKYKRKGPSYFFGSAVNYLDSSF